MKRLLAASLALPLLLAALSSARADLPPPPLPMGQKVKLVVLVDERAEQPRLIIPKSALQGGKSGDKEETSNLGLPTIVAGLSLTAAFVTGGFWLVRRGRGPGRAAVTVLVLSLLAVGASAVWADIPGPPRPRPRPLGPVQLSLPASVQLSDPLMVEVVEKGDAITLLVNKKAVAAQQPAPSEEKKDKN